MKNKKILIACGIIAGILILCGLCGGGIMNFMTSSMGGVFSEVFEEGLTARKETLYDVCEASDDILELEEEDYFTEYYIENTDYETAQDTVSSLFEDYDCETLKSDSKWSLFTTGVSITQDENETTVEFTINGYKVTLVKEGDKFLIDDIE